MARKSVFLMILMTWVTGCTSSDPMGLRSSYRDRVVPPTNTRSISNPPIAGQPPQLAQAARAGQFGILPGAAVSQMAHTRPAAGNYPLLASAGGQFDGRAMPVMNGRPGMGYAGAPYQMASSASAAAIADGVAPAPAQDLKYRGGRTIRDLKYMNIYVGDSEAWDSSDWRSIDKKLAAAMADRRLNNVLVQYFDNKPISSQFVGSFFLTGWKPQRVTKAELEAQIESLYRQKLFNGRDLANTVVNFMLPKGCVLADPNGGSSEDSTAGLAGYHGSVRPDDNTIYYAVGVYSERLSGGRTNGIPVFDASWKNVVATFYHQLQEVRTDPDVDDALESPNGKGFLGWTSDNGDEIADYPISEAVDLAVAFREIPLADGSGTAPIQLMYSNAVHGPEGPIEYPHGTQPPPANNTPDNPPPTNGPTVPANLPPQIQKMIREWDQMEDYVKQAILKLLS
ncbi:hypothetical protein [Schlesneria sp. T3-172]|uniref:hypothetical protein n=1 Tax=Schlesneria sphaerica TaxID=3373610 RepID=UPI0037C61B2C